MKVLYTETFGVTGLMFNKAGRKVKVAWFLFLETTIFLYCVAGLKWKDL